MVTEPMCRTFKKIVRCMVPGVGFFGYLLYTLAVLLFLLWYEFPADAVKTRIEQDFNRMTPALRWDTGTISLIFPADIQLKDIKISDKVEKKVLFKINALSLRPDLLAWKETGMLSAKYRLQISGGTVVGQLRLDRDHAAIQYRGEMKDIKIDSDSLKTLLQEYDRTLSGVLFGTFTGKGEMPNKILSTAQGLFRVDNGSISLQKPVLGMEELVFERLSGKMSYDDEVVHLADGAMKSRAFSAEFNGTLQPDTPFQVSKIKATGSLLPRPELLASMGDPSVVNILRKQLREGRLPFTITGPLQAPGIFFTGLPADFNTLPNKLPSRGDR